MRVLVVEDEKDLGDVFRDFLVLHERRDGLMQLRVRPWSGEGEALGSQKSWAS